LEIIVCDDASTDGSVRYLQELKSPYPLRLLRNKRNSGSVFSQWAKGLAAARADFIWIAEADDSCEPEFLDKLVALAQRNPSAGFVYSQSRIIDSRGRTLEETPRYLSEIHQSRWARDYFARGADEVTNYLVLRNTVPNASACLFRREAIVSLDLANLPLKLCGDWWCYVELLRRYDVAFLAEPLNYYRRHGQTVRSGSERTGLRLSETYAVQRHITENFSVDPAIRERACRFSFREWIHLIESKQLKLDEPIAAELRNIAKRFDPHLEWRFDHASDQRLACVCLRYRSWRSAWRWKQCWRTYPEGAAVEIKLGPCQGEVEIEPLLRSGRVVISALKGREVGSERVIFSARGPEVGRILGRAGNCAQHTCEAGVQVSRGPQNRFLPLLVPHEFLRRPFFIEMTLQADPPLEARPEREFEQSL
jgi:glycosyltransferase involved in cell wall biosynthesis